MVKLNCIQYLILDTYKLLFYNFWDTIQKCKFDSCTPRCSNQRIQVVKEFIRLWQLSSNYPLEEQTRFGKRRPKCVPIVYYCRISKQYIHEHMRIYQEQRLFWGHRIKAIISALHAEDQVSITCGSTSFSLLGYLLNCNKINNL